MLIVQACFVYKYTILYLPEDQCFAFHEINHQSPHLNLRKRNTSGSSVVQGCPLNLSNVAAGEQ